MTALVPNRCLFAFEFPLSYRPALPPIDGDVEKWSAAEALPKLGELDGREDFADLWACWNEQGLALACRVSGKRKPLNCDPQRYWAGDNLRLCIDTRDARSNRRGTRYCQQFYFLPTGGGADKRSPVAGAARLQRAREDAPAVPAERLQVAVRVTRGGYSLEALIPADCLSGFDPAEHPRIGFYYIVEDADFGQQYPTVGDELLWYVDPSTWPTAILSQSI